MSTDVNPADSLRAAALSTIKAKRKRIEKPTRPALDTSAVLDYGQDDLNNDPSAPGPTTIQSDAGPPHETTIKQTANSKPLNVLPEYREDGEISDSDNRRETQLPQAVPEVTAPLKELPPQQLPVVTQPSIKREPDSPRSSELNKTFPISILADPPTNDVVMEEPFSVTKDVECIRPGLILNQIQYDHAKDLVLDLLGWGVSSEYLVDCGLSRELVFYVFTELQLRFPSNFDPTGLPPPREKIYPRQEPASFPQPKPSSAISRTDSFPLQPPINLTSAPNLHDIEQQRRQEILARKAAQASRKSKREEADNAAHTAERVPHSTRAAAPEEDVDNFLKSIAPSDLPEDPMDVDDPPLQQNVTRPSLNDMHNCEPYPAQTSVQHSSAQLYSSLIPTPSTSSIPFNEVPESPHPPDSANSTATLPPDTAPLPADSESASFVSTPRESTPTMSARRSAKRPVAADFVDFESAPPPRLQNLYQRNGSTSNGHGASTSLNGLKYSTSNSSFASVSGARRCVIDLSDSEDDGRGFEVAEGEAGNGNRAPTRLQLAYDSLKGRPMSPIVSSGITTPAAGPSSRGMSPASLEAKEQEIKRMRELIAKREQSRLSKLSRVEPISSPAEGVDGPRRNLVNSSETGQPMNGSSHVEVAEVPFEANSASSAAQENEPQYIVSPTIPDSATHDSEASPRGIKEPPDSSQLDQEPIVQGDPASHTLSTALAPIQVTIESQAVDQSYSGYTSIFRGLPLLRTRNGSTRSYQETPPASTLAASTAVTGNSREIPVLNLWPLKVLHKDPMKPICRYEISGGECRDLQCDDVHFSRQEAGNEMVHLRDEEIAGYVDGALASDWRVRHGVDSHKILKALQDTRYQDDSGHQYGKTLEDRVNGALRLLAVGG